MSIKAEDMKRRLRPLAAEGNPHAAVACLRLDLAEDPEAEAQRIIDEWERTFAAIRQMWELVWPGLIDLMGPN